MHTAELVFRSRRGKCETDDASSAICGYLVALKRNGQIVDRHFVVFAIRGGFKAVVGLPEPTSLRAPRFSKDVRDNLQRLEDSGITVSKGRVIGVDMDSGPICGCRNLSSLILDSTLYVEGLLWCGECFGNVPLYRIPHTSEHGTYEDVLGWAWRSRALDRLWMGSSVGEKCAFRELSRHDSYLSTIARDICRCIEKGTGIKTYRYLLRYYARSLQSERKRPCPGCGRTWLVEPAWFGRYDFRCDRCRLVSNISYDVR